MSPEWKKFIDQELQKPYMKELKQFIDQERATKTILPHPTDTFNAFSWCPWEKLKVVILGQDPYYTPGQAHGLAFSSIDYRTPPSLKTVFNEVWNDYWGKFHEQTSPEAQNKQYANCFAHNNLKCWAVQGVLLLNAILTVEQGKPLSHEKKNWEQFTVNCIDKISKESEHPVVFMLWGKKAQGYEKVISLTKHQHLILKANHPAAESYSPGAGGFLGCKHFTQANEFISKRKAPAHWQEEFNQKKTYENGKPVSPPSYRLQPHTLTINWLISNLN